VPLLLAGFGIVLRGCGFAFRKFASTMGQARAFGAVFALSSLITPLFFGMAVGGIASGRVPLDGGDPWTSWTGPTSWVGGALAVLTCAFLAATFLAADAQRSGSVALASDCGRKALIAGVITGAVALGAIPLIESDAETLAHDLQGRAAPLVIVSAAAGLLSLLDLRGRRYARARLSAVVAVAAIVGGWGVAQYPDLLVDHQTLDQAAGADASLAGLVVVFGLAAVTAVPSMLWLFALVNKREWADPH
jgi:cytochrome d ubiquinol oxidase subunit II